MDKAILDALLGRSIRVDRGGPESRTGKLIATKDDHFVVYNENDGMLYYRIEHVKSLTLDTRNLADAEDPNEVQTYIPKHIEADNFNSVLKEMRLHWVQINRGGPEKVEGVLIDATDTHVTVISGNEVVKVLTYHIRNISYGLKKNNEQEKDKNKDNNKENNKNEDNK
ncbi:hypothetical protein ACFSO0_13485 [Brevibacillus sp. GCM10020057]|uniref:hypothetical protein n=1 Tax=Brevibacillus sp. GCM10020057 TaxID=3317327 RepID=UPI00363C6838